MAKEISWIVKLKSGENILGIVLWGLGIMIVSATFIWLLHNFLGGLAVLALGILYLRFYHLSPIEKKVILDKKGIVFGGDKYLFSEILSFATSKIKEKEFVLFFTTSRATIEVSIELPQTLLKKKIIHFLKRELPRQKRLNIFSAFHFDSYLGA